jgi:hypothetical protein
VEAGWIVGELEGPDGPGLEAGAPQQILAGQRAVVAGSGADQEDPRPAGEPGDGRRWRRIPKETPDGVGL